VNPTGTDAWQRLDALAGTDAPAPTDDALLEAAGLLADFSRQRWNPGVLDTLLQLAREQSLPERIRELFRGARLNRTEDRPALHTALRAAAEDAAADGGPGAEIPAAVAEQRQRMLVFADAVRSGRWRGFSGKAIRRVVHLGIGGSHLGPELVVRALPAARPVPEVRFAANIDGQALAGALDGASAETTLFIVASKSFGTLETRQNADSARRWFLERCPDPAAIARHFVAVSSNVDAAEAFGIPPENRFPMWDWVGGRFSLWSAVGLPIALHLGGEGFERLLAGARAMDRHFLEHGETDRLRTNLPLRLALAGLWNTSFRGATSHVVVPYAEALALLPDYLQQLEMESNGKSVDLDGEAVGYATAPVLWGNVGTNGQHAFFQLLHQGSANYSADFIMLARASTGGTAAGGAPGQAHQHWLQANALAQAQAMSDGAAHEDPHRVVPGGHPSTTLILPDASPESLGALLALYEHKVFCQGILWHINSFDQWGVELGKRLAEPLYARLSGAGDAVDDAVSERLIDRLERLQRH